MSDIPHGTDWWQGTDGKWYPPVAHADNPGAAPGDTPPDAPTADPAATPPPPPPGADAGSPAGAAPPPPPPGAIPAYATPMPAPAAATSRTGLWIVLALVAVVIVGGIGAIAAVTLLGSKSSHTITGEFTLMSSSIGSSGSSCYGIRGYDDIEEGANVKLTDESGKILATSALGRGERDTGTCTFHFTLDDVPDADFYNVEVSHRGGLTYSRADLEERDWTIYASLGS